MSKKPTLLIIGNYNRRDYVDLFEVSRNHFNFFFLEFASVQEITSDYYRKYGKAIFWGDFKSANDLLLQIKPHKVLFFFIESYFHVILNLTCKLTGIPTYHLDHGLRDVNINTRLAHLFVNQKGKPPHIRRIQKVQQFLPRIRARLFLRNSVKALPPPEASFFDAFYDIRKVNHYLETFELIKSPLRTAAAYITFSSKVYEVHQQHDFLHETAATHFIGIPFYDHLAVINPAPLANKQILYVDQGLASRELLGWTGEKYNIFISEFNSICAKYGFKLLVKLHPVQPKQEEQLWAAHHNVTLIDNDQLTEALPSTPLVIGYFSTYLLPLVALEHTTVLTLENHPAGRLDVSKSFIDAGVAHPVYTLDELEWALENIEQLHQQQLPNKARFTADWMYKFDGKAGERLRDILLSNEL